MRSEDYDRLRSLLLRDEREGGALVLCGRSQHFDPWTGVLEERALVREVVEMPEEAFLSRTATSLVWSTTPLFNLAKRAMEGDLAICVAHSHPSGALYFSAMDDVADREAFDIVFGRMETTRPHFSMVMDQGGSFIVRAYGPSLRPLEVELTRTIGDRWVYRHSKGVTARPRAELDRQVRTFGSAAVENLTNLRIGIVGCGGTGSAVALLLTRLGVRKLALIDHDFIDETNLNRLHFSKRADAILRRRKVDVVAEAIADIGLSESVVRIPTPVDSPECRDVLRSCDLIFGCTDDHLGRSFLNRLAYFYLIPVVDLGLLIEPVQDGTYSTFDGRVTVVQPGNTCQVCRRLIDPRRLLEESLRRNDSQVFGEYRRAGYVADSADPSPVVVTFTTELAALAVNELLQRLTGFRGPLGHCSERVRRFDGVKDTDIVPGGTPLPECPLCGRRAFDGRGDMSPFLNQT